MPNDMVPLQEKARFIRRNILEMIVAANKGHIGGAFSCVDNLMLRGLASYSSNNKLTSWSKYLSACSMCPID